MKAPILSKKMLFTLLALFGTVGAVSAVLPVPYLISASDSDAATAPLQRQLGNEFLVKQKGE